MPQADIVRVLNGLDNEIAERVKEVSFGLVANLVETTPVDTGWARANWVPRIGADNEGVITQQGDPGAASADQAAATARLAAYHIAAGKVFVSNHVDYIGDLNNGTSSQAPAGFVQAAIEKAVREST